MDLKLGISQTLSVKRIVDSGYILTNSTNKTDVLLHKHEAANELKVDDTVQVFLYNNQDNDIVATMKVPSIQIGSFDWAEVVEVIPRLGIFVDIGIDKDMLILADDLPVYKSVWPLPGDKLYVTLTLDYKNRLLAIPATEEIFMEMRELAPEELLNKAITGHVYYTSREGSAIFTEDGHRGFIHHTEREREPRLGERVNGRVIDVKEDATINVSLLPRKHERINDDAEKILAALNQNDGIIPFTDKSDPEAIRETFGFSKSAFKRALGKLLKEKKVVQRDGKTYLF